MLVANNLRYSHLSCATLSIFNWWTEENYNCIVSNPTLLWLSPQMYLWPVCSLVFMALFVLVQVLSSYMIADILAQPQDFLETDVLSPKCYCHQSTKVIVAKTFPLVRNLLCMSLCDDNIPVFIISSCSKRQTGAPVKWTPLLDW